MKYTVIKSFTDKNPNGAKDGKKQIYWKDDTYPAGRGYAGATTNDRIAELTEGGWIKEKEDK